MGKYYSEYSGLNIDKAYTAVKLLNNSDSGKVPVISTTTSVKSSTCPTLIASDIDLSDVATKPTNPVDGKFVKTDSEGNLSTSSYGEDSYYLVNSGIAVGHLVAMGDNNRLVDAGESDPSERLDELEEEMATVRSEFNEVLTRMDEYDTRIPIIEESITQINDIIQKVIDNEVSFTEIDQPEYDGYIYYTETVEGESVSHIVYEVYDPDDTSQQIPVYGYMGARQEDARYITLNSYTEYATRDIDFVLADYIPRPANYYTTEGKQTLKAMIDNVAIWGENGTLKDSGISLESLESLLEAGLETRVTALEADVEAVKGDVEDIQTDIETNYVKKEITVGDVATSVLRYKIVDGESYVLSNYYDIEEGVDVSSQITAEVDGEEVNVYYGGITVQLYAEDGVTMVYPVTL